MYVRGLQHSIIGGGFPPVYSSGGETPPHFARIDAYDRRKSRRVLGSVAYGRSSYQYGANSGGNEEPVRPPGIRWHTMRIISDYINFNISENVNDVITQLEV